MVIMISIRRAHIGTTTPIYSFLLFAYIRVEQHPKGVDSSLKSYMMCMGHNEIKPPLIYKNFIEKNKRIRTNGRLEI